MNVIKRGVRGFEPIQFDKITVRIANLCEGLTGVVPAHIAQITIKNLYNGIKTEEIDIISAKIAEERKTESLDYGVLASRILISNMHKCTKDSFSACIAHINASSNMIGAAQAAFIAENAAALDAMIVPARDYSFDYFGIKTLMRSYLIHIKSPVYGADGDPVYVNMGGKVITDTTISAKGRVVYVDGDRVRALKVQIVKELCDRPQYMFMRVAISLYRTLDEIKRCYESLSTNRYTHATPTLFNASSRKEQLNSCFLLGSADSIEGIMKTVSDSSFISKGAGGIGVWMHYIRSERSYINGTNGESSGIPKQIKIYDAIVNAWDQGGKRKGAIAIYIEPWHGDIVNFLQMKLQQGSDSERARDLFYALWVPDLFIRRAFADEVLSLFSNDTAPGLADVYDGMDVCSKCNYCANFNYAKYLGGADDLDLQKCCNHEFAQADAFTALYTMYEEEGLAVGEISAKEILDAICLMQRESGTPYILHKDHINRMSNQSNVDTVRSSNLCVRGDTYVLTNSGQFMISDIVNKTVDVWNGHEFTQTTPRLTARAQGLLRVSLSNGTYIDCTPEHIFILADGGKCAARNLTMRSALITYDLPVIQCVRDYPFDLSSKMNTVACETPYQFVPLDARIEHKLEWLSGFCRGQFEMDHPAPSVTFLRKLRLLLQTIGVDSHVDKSALRLIISSAAPLVDFGINEILVSWFIVGQLAPVSVVAVDDFDVIEDTYCFTESARGMGMFNGILTGQCAEIVEVSTPDSYACCTLASVNLKAFLVRANGAISPNCTTSAKWIIDHAALHAEVRSLTRNLDRVIDINAYPVEECSRNSRSYRPIGIGIQGLANVFMIMRIPFLSAEAARVDLEIAETIYHAALTETCALSALGSHDGFIGSPTNLGLLHPDLWMRNQRRIGGFTLDPRSSRYDWEATAAIARLGRRNSHIVAGMPTVSTSQILGNNESFEPFQSNIYTKTTLAGKFVMVNADMVAHMTELGLWNDQMYRDIVNGDGSVQHIEAIPADVREIYKTVWEMKQTELMARAAIRGAFIDQSQSLNIYLRDNSTRVLRGVMKAGWKYGLKTGSYYIKTLAASGAIKTSIANDTKSAVEGIKSSTEALPTDGEVCRMEEGCIMCSG